MKVAILLVALVALVVANEASLRDSFLHFQRTYKKVYSSQKEFENRFAIFKQNMAEAAELQKKNPKARFGVTKFSDLSKEEFSNFYLMPNFMKTPYTAPSPINRSQQVVRPGAPQPDPNNWDWAQNAQGIVSPVKNQGQCGSCWAFSATETIESYNAIAGNGLTTLSVEQIVDCDTSGQDQGCNGGFPSGAYEYIESAGGQDTDASYPYTAENGNGGTCNFQQANVAATVASYASVSGETGLYTQASTIGPVSVCVDASSWSSYQGGVLSTCGNNVDHCVQLTGYGQYDQLSSNGAYWIVRNSWGTDWGISGYIEIEIGQDLCSIGDYATVVATGSP